MIGIVSGTMMPTFFPTRDPELELPELLAAAAELPDDEDELPQAARSGARTAAPPSSAPPPRTSRLLTDLVLTLS
jgi:hypothetical protein